MVKGKGTRKGETLAGGNPGFLNGPGNEAKFKELMQQLLMKIVIYMFVTQEIIVSVK